jgi:hypothetical protein
MRTITTLFGSTLCAFALLVAPVQAKDKSTGTPATCPTCPSKDPAPAKESINVGDNGKCDKKDCDKDKPTTCPDKDSASAKESGKCDKKDDDKEKPAVCPSCPKPETK